MLSDDDLDHVNRRLTNLQRCAMHRRTIRVACPRCGHSYGYDAVPLWWMFEKKRWDDRITMVAQRLYCARCRQRNGRKIRPNVAITRAMPDPAQPPYPDKSIWRRLVSRYRS